jgi:hypothetical protein
MSAQAPDSCCAVVKSTNNRCKYRGTWTWEGQRYCKVHLPVEECSICYEGITQRAQVRLECSHRFHSRCIRKWVDSDHLTCPLCRTTLSEAALEKINPRLEDSVHAFLVDFQGIGVSQEEVDRFITNLLNLHILAVNQTGQ